MAVTTFDIDEQRRDIDVAEDIARLEPDVNPFAVILMRARKKPTRTNVFYWYDEEPMANWTQINNAGGYTAGATSLVVDDSTIFEPKDLVKVPRTGEVMYISAVDDATNTLTVTRGYGTTAAAAINDDDWLLRLGNAMEQNSTAPAEKIIQPTEYYNYVQTVRTPFSQADESDAEALETNESERQRLRRDKAFDHRLDLESIAIAGERKKDVTNKRQTTAGLLYYITSNVTDQGGILTEAAFEDYCQTLFAKGSDRKLLVCSATVLTAINRFAAGKLETTSGEETYGIRMRRYLSAHGELLLIKSKALRNYYDGWALGLDMANIWYRPLRGRDTKLSTNIQENDRDGWKDEYITKFGMQVRLEKTHAILKGVIG